MFGVYLDTGPTNEETDTANGGQCQRNSRKMEEFIIMGVLNRAINERLLSRETKSPIVTHKLLKHVVKLEVDSKHNWSPANIVKLHKKEYIRGKPTDHCTIKTPLYPTNMLKKLLNQ